MSDKQGRWVKCSDRLPSTEDHYMVKVKDCRGLCTRRFKRDSWHGGQRPSAQGTEEVLEWYEDTGQLQLQAA